jgi:hypothetical protein
MTHLLRQPAFLLSLLGTVVLFAGAAWIGGSAAMSSATVLSAVLWSLPFARQIAASRQKPRAVRIRTLR